MRHILQKTASPARGASSSRCWCSLEEKGSWLPWSVRWRHWSVIRYVHDLQILNESRQYVYYRSYRYRRMESMRSSIKTPLTWLTSGNKRDRRPTHLLPEMASSPSFQNQVSKLHHRHSCSLSISRAEKIFNPSTVSCTTCTTTRDRRRISLGEYATYRQHVRRKHLLGILQGKVLHLILSPGSLIPVILLLSSSAFRIA